MHAKQVQPAATELPTTERGHVTLIVEFNLTPEHRRKLIREAAAHGYPTLEEYLEHVLSDHADAALAAAREEQT